MDASIDSIKRHAVVIAAMLTIFANVPRAATESDAPHVRIRILDYAGITNDVIAYAQQRVSDIYQTIGVEIRWQVTYRPLVQSSSVAKTLTEPSDFVIIVPSPDMSRHLKVPKDAMGMAIVSSQGGGRIAYVLFHRVTLVAKTARSAVADILGMVIAHEIGHLMLPNGSHSDYGLMRADWSITELRRLRRPAVEFTSSQGAAILRRILDGRASAQSMPLHKQPATAERSAIAAATMTYSAPAAAAAGP